MAARLIYGDETRLLPWAAERIGIASFRRDAYTIGLERDGVLAAVAVYDNFSEGDCNVHLASDGSKRWMSKEFLLAGFAYPFVQLGLRRITGLVDATNEAALTLNEHLGYVREGLCRDGLPNADLVVMGMLRAECRFVSKEQQHG